MSKPNAQRYIQPNVASRLGRVFLPVAALFWFLVACGAATPTAITATARPVATVGTTAGGTPDVITVVPTPSAGDKAVVTGFLLENTSNQPKPATGLILYLADILPEAKGTPFLASFDRVHSIRTLTDSTGRFVFADVHPATYSLVLDRVAEAFLLGDPKKPGSDFTFTPQSGKLLDLGKLVYAVLPGSSSAP